MKAERARAIAGSAAFLIAAPGVAAGLVPWLITGWVIEERLPGAIRLAGAVLVAIAALALLYAFAEFALEGLGTPAPIAPTRHLVVGGVYRFVRNPMYVAVLSIIAGQALIWGSATLVIYGASLGTAFALFVRLYEEPTMRATYGAEYERYRAAVPGWIRGCGPGAAVSA